VAPETPIERPVDSPLSTGTQLGFELVSVAHEIAGTG